MSTAIIVDQNCDLPDAVISAHNIKVLPQDFTVNGSTSRLTRSEQSLLDIYASGQLDKRNHLAVDSSSLPAVKAFFESEIQGKFEHALVQTVSKAHALAYDDINSSIARMTSDSLKIRLVGSKVISAGQAVVALYAAKLAAQGASGPVLRQKTDLLTDKLYNYSISPDLDYVHAQGKRRGEKTVNKFMAKIGSMAKIAPIVCFHHDKIIPVDQRTRGFEASLDKLINHTIEQIKQGLLTPVICVSYAGDIADLNQFASFKLLEKQCRELNIELHTATMGLGSAINLGAQSFCIGFAADKHTLLGQ